MAVDVAPPTAPENKAVAAVRGIPSFYQAVLAEMKKVTWPDRAQLQDATIKIIIFVLFLGAIIALMDLFFQAVFVSFIPSLFK